jgi:acetyl esterase/lipase
MCDFSAYGTPSDAWVAAALSLPAAPEALGVLERRALTNRVREKVAAEFMKVLGPQVVMRDHTIPSRGGPLAARSYRPADAEPADAVLPVYMHLHGGGFHYGTLAAEDAVCARLAARARVVVLSVNYRHTPEHPYPAAWDDTHDAFAWLHDHVADEAAGLFGDPQRVVIGGISAGAELAASFALQQALGHAAASRPALAGQLLMIPALVQMDCYGPVLQQLRDPSVSSYEQNKAAPILSLDSCKFFTSMLKFENSDENDVRMNPGNATSAQVKGLPPTVFGIAGFDPLRDEGLLYAKRLTESG